MYIEAGKKTWVLCLVLGIIIWSGAVFAEEVKIARSNRTLWPYALNKRELFDKASEHEMLAFVMVFSDTEEIMTDEVLKKEFGLRKVNLEAIKAYRKRMQRNLLWNFNKMGKPYAWRVILQKAKDLKEQTPGDLKPWYKDAVVFYRDYLYEHLKLAAAFPAETSEVDALDKTEILGQKLKDRNFMLSFDNGPTLPKKGETDRLIALLREHRKPAAFFVIGEKFKDRLTETSSEALNALYQGFTVGSHGYVHLSYPSMPTWKESLMLAHQQLSVTLPKLTIPFFLRPPSGERNRAMVGFVKEKGWRTMLWNIDAYDWMSRMTDAEVRDRLISLMLFWRSGIILMHDTHKRAQVVLPEVFKTLEGSGITWITAKEAMQQSE